MWQSPSYFILLHRSKLFVEKTYDIISAHRSGLKQSYVFEESAPMELVKTVFYFYK